MTIIDLTPIGPSVDAPDAVVLRPLYDGHEGEASLAGALFFRVTPQIAIERTAPSENPLIVATGVASLEAAAGIGGAMEAVWSRVIDLIDKALRLSNAASAGTVDTKPVRAISTPDMLSRSAKMVARMAARAAYELCCHPSHWRVGWRFVPPGDDVWSRHDLGGRRWNVLADPVDHFYADPFPFSREGRDFLFFEDLDYKTGKGIIAVSAFDAEGHPGTTIPVLEEPWHLSYPFLIEQGGNVFMIPEGSASRQIVLYRAVDFPQRWERHAVLVDNVEAADATIIEHDGLLWMFAVTREGIGGYSDTLRIWYAGDLTGPWQPHPGNPVLVDDRTARPAGNFMRRNGALFRPVQDCRAAYGGATNLMRVTRLDTQGFAQEKIASLNAGSAWPGRRIHTLNYNGSLEAIDGFVLRPKLKLLADLVDRRFQPKS